MFIVLNRNAGRRNPERFRQILSALSSAGMLPHVLETASAGDGARIAGEIAATGAPLVAAAGGDGTVAEVANGLQGSHAMLGVIPLGTANVLAHELALPFAPPDIAACLQAGETRNLWPGSAQTDSGSRLFLQMASVGFDAEVVRNLPLKLKRAIGRGAYVAQTLRELLRYRFPPIALRIDGRAERAAGVIVSKGRFYAGRYLLAPCAKPHEPGFSVALFRRAGLLPALTQAAALPLNLLPRLPGWDLVRADEVVIETTGVAAQADGDILGASPLTIRNFSTPIRVVINPAADAVTPDGGFE